MPLIDYELTAPIRRFDDLRRAERARLLASAESASQARITSLIGRWLIDLGQRLETLRVARSDVRPMVLPADLCGGCAN